MIMKMEERRKEGREAARRAKREGGRRVQWRREDSNMYWVSVNTTGRNPCCAIDTLLPPLPNRRAFRTIIPAISHLRGEDK